MFSKSIKLISASNITRSQLILTRTCTSKLDPVKDWWKPRKVCVVSKQYSGDMKDHVKANDEDYFNDYIANSPEIKDANDLVKRIFKLEMQPRKMGVYAQKLEAIKDVQRHLLDFGSVETKIAQQTIKIRALQELREKHPRNGRLKVHLKELIDRRFSFLSHLRRWDYQKFEWILEKFDIIYKPFPEDQKKVYDVRARRPSIRQLTDVYVDKIKQEKLDEYRKELESKQLDFLKKKVETLEFIRNEQIECKVPVTVTTDEIKIARKQYENLKKQREEEQEVIMKQSVREDYELKL